MAFTQILKKLLEKKVIYKAQNLPQAEPISYDYAGKADISKGYCNYW